MRGSGDPPIPPVVWVVIAGAFILVLATADGAGQRIAQVGVMLALLGMYVLVRHRRG